MRDLEASDAESRRVAQQLVYQTLDFYFGVGMYQVEASTGEVCLRVEAAGLTPIAYAPLWRAEQQLDSLERELCGLYHYGWPTLWMHHHDALLMLMTVSPLAYQYEDGFELMETGRYACRMEPQYIVHAQGGYDWGFSRATDEPARQLLIRQAMSMSQAGYAPSDALPQPVRAERDRRPAYAKKRAKAARRRQRSLAHRTIIDDSDYCEMRRARESYDRDRIATNSQSGHLTTAVAAVVVGLAAWKVGDLAIEAYKGYQRISLTAKKLNGVVEAMAKAPEALRNCVGSVITPALGLALASWLVRLPTNPLVAHVTGGAVTVGLAIVAGVKHALGSLRGIIRAAFVSMCECLGFTACLTPEGLLDTGDIVGRSGLHTTSEADFEFDTDSFLSTFVNVASLAMIGPKMFAKAPVTALFNYIKTNALVSLSFDKKKGLLTWCVDGFVAVVNAVSKFFGGPSFAASQSLAVCVKQWGAGVDHALASVEGFDQVTTVHYAKLTNYHSRGTLLIRGEKLEVGEASYVQMKLKALSNELARARWMGVVYNTTRNQPVCVCLSGDRGVGKTTVAQLISSIIHKRLHPEGDASGAHYTPVSGSDFEDHYMNNTVYLIDDWMQDRTLPGAQPNDVSKIIRLVNCEPCPLNVAFGGKGKVYMTSPLVLLTTNHRNCEAHVANYVNCTDAVDRRLKYKYVVTRKDGVTFDTAAWEEWTRRWSGVPNGAVLSLAEWLFTPVTLRGEPGIGPAIDGVELLRIVAKGVDAVVQPSPLNAFDLDMPLDFLANHTSQPPRPDNTTSQAGWFDDEPMYMKEVEQIDQEAEAMEASLRGLTQEELAKMAPLIEEARREIKASRDSYLLLAAEARTYGYKVAKAIAAFVPLVAAAAMFLGAWHYAIAPTFRLAGRLVFGDSPTTNQSSDVDLRGVEPTNREKTIAKIQRNMVTFYANMADGRRRRLANGLFVGARQIVLPHHVGMEIDHYGGFVTCSRGKMIMEVRPGGLTRLYEDKGRDVMYIQTSAGGMRSDLTGVMVSAREAVSACAAGGWTLLRVSGECEQEQTFHTDNADIDSVTEAGFYTTTNTPWLGEGSTAVTAKPFYNITGIRSGPGWCGGVYITSGNAPKIIAMHAAGVGTHTQAFAVNRDLLVKAGYTPPARIVLPTVVKHTPLVGELSEFDQWNLFSESQAGVASNTTSSKTKTRLAHDAKRPDIVIDEHGVATIAACATQRPWCSGLTLKPARLRPFTLEGRRVDPMRLALSYYHRPVIELPGAKVHRAICLAMGPFSRASRGLYRGVLDTSTAVFGDGEGGLFEPIPADKSPGYLLRIEGMTSRTQVLDFQNKTISVSFQTRLADLEDALDRGDRVVFPYIDFLKDEVLDAKKVDGGKARLISASCLEYVVLWRKYFGAFTSAVMRTRIDSGMMLGFQPQAEALQVLNHFQGVADGAFIAGDYSKFDSSQQPQVINAIMSYIISWLGGEPRDKRIRVALARDLISSVHVNGLDDSGEFGSTKRTLYFWNVSMPSGHPATTVINCMYNLFAFAYSYIEICGGEAEYHKLVRLVVYGDDSLVKVSTSIQDKYNQPAIAEVMRQELGMTYTNSTKDGVSVDFMPLDQATFLKRSFRSDITGAPCMPIALESLNKALCWTTRGTPEEMAKRESLTLSNVLLELSMHDRLTWSEYTGHLRACGATLLEGVYDESAESQAYYLAKARRDTSMYS